MVFSITANVIWHMVITSYCYNGCYWVFDFDKNYEGRKIQYVLFIWSFSSCDLIFTRTRCWWNSKVYSHHPYSLCYLKLILFFVYRGFPTKLVLYSWWIFLVFLVSSYTANLAAVFTTNMLDSEIESIQDLFSSPKIKFGTITGGAFNALKVYIYLYQYFWLQQGLKIC